MEWWTSDGSPTDHGWVIRMSDDAHKVPAVTKAAFNCPHCDAYAEQSWFPLFAVYPDEAQWAPYEQNANISRASQLLEKHRPKNVPTEDILAGKAVLSDHDDIRSGKLLHNVHASRCSHCREVAVWVNDKMVLPSATLGIRPSQDIPDQIKGLFEEAREVAAASPRSAAALLRLCIESLCKHLGADKGSLDKSIAALVKNGLSPRLQRMLDSVRVIGNHAVHPGKLDEGDSKERVLLLFEVVNLIAEQMISQPRKIDQLYEGFPEDVLKRIDQRDQGRRRE